MVFDKVTPCLANAPIRMRALMTCNNHISPECRCRQSSMYGDVCSYRAHAVGCVDVSPLGRTEDFCDCDCDYDYDCAREKNGTRATAISLSCRRG
jgi:hypothetical protein